MWNNEKLDEHDKASHEIIANIINVLAILLLIFPLVFFFVLVVNQEYKSSLYSVQFTMIDIINVFIFYITGVGIYYINKNHKHNIYTACVIVGVIALNCLMFNYTNLSSYHLFEISTIYVVVAIIGSLVLSIILFRIGNKMITQYF
ncbi:heme/copper-type cytochrome/quinol oxidase subunit 4 [Breznakia pachnodae]|uniref:Heme/copper-type cytochrome/quinol oxidase subunit 4 n=1 Tax=Breznakia pachnodae TaxID=265178 RepID=A0ABU0E2N8_9FIRM|nr:heme/copper-type cytochrome/quinol oxidase subunit 4 [Breznakia pachnodae]